MSFGKMNTLIDIIAVDVSTDAEGFGTATDTVVASIHAYHEDRHGTTIWANRAAFFTASCLFRFRVIPDVEVTTKHQIHCDGKRYRILSVEDVRGRGMYIEAMADRMEASKSGKS